MLRYVNPENITTGTVNVFWEESDIGLVSMRCPCGNLSKMLGINITRTCRGDFFSQATWDDPIDDICGQLDFTICSISTVRNFKF